MEPVYQGCHMVTAAIDALATLRTGSKRYFHSQTMRGARYLKSPPSAERTFWNQAPAQASFDLLVRQLIANGLQFFLSVLAYLRIAHSESFKGLDENARSY